MSGQAQITSLQSLESFRSDLVVYLSQMLPVIDETAGEVTRMKSWLQNERREFWENELRKRRRKLEEAQSELFSVQLSRMQDSSTAAQFTAQRAQRAVREAEDKLACLKKWNREIETLADPLVKQVGQLQGFLTTDLGKAVASLTETIKTLEAYTAVTAPGLSAAPVPPADSNKAAA
jgi:hypothetical protein